MWDNGGKKTPEERNRDHLSESSRPDTLFIGKKIETEFQYIIEDIIIAVN